MLRSPAIGERSHCFALPQPISVFLPTRDITHVPVPPVSLHFAYRSSAQLTLSDVKVKFARLLRRLRLLYTLPYYYGVAAFRYGFHPLSAVRSLSTALYERYWPEEAYGLGLLRPGANAHRSPQFLSKAHMVALQRRLNLEAWEFVLSDKGVFARFAMAASLPTPSLVALYYRNTAGCTGAGELLASGDEWRRFLETGTPQEFVVKPARSSYGSSVHLFRRKGRVFTDFHGRSFSAADLHTMLGSESGHDAMIIQERVHNHPDLVRLSGAEGLQTVRIVTFVGTDGTIHVVNAFFKPIVGRNHVDNFKHGATGNLLATVSLDDGSLRTGITHAPGGGILEVPRHPETGVIFGGFRLPYWVEACALARRAAAVFLPVRMVGWDVALSPAGPLLIEGNFWPDPPTMTCSLDRILETLKA